MKLVIAYIRPNCAEAVLNQLRAEGIDQGSIVPAAMGFGHEKAQTMTIRGQVVVTEAGARARTRLEVAVEDRDMNRAVRAISEAARTGAVGDGRIFVVPLEECINIRTRQRRGTPRREVNDWVTAHAAGE